MMPKLKEIIKKKGRMTIKEEKKIAKRNKKEKAIND
jgi:hypothetical protein